LSLTVCPAKVVLLPDGDECHDQLQNTEYDRDDDFWGCTWFTHDIRLGKVFLYYCKIKGYTLKGKLEEEEMCRCRFYFIGIDPTDFLLSLSYIPLT
jgi:hypothetical protein